MPRASRTRQVEKTLKAQYRLKHFGSIADGRAKAALKMATAKSDESAQLLNPAVRVIREPADASIDR